MAIILHPDLRKASPIQIKKELQYLVSTHIPGLLQSISLGVFAVANQGSPDLPLWMQNRDLTDACDRVQAIIEEIQHREI